MCTKSQTTISVGKKIFSPHVSDGRLEEAFGVVLVAVLAVHQVAALRVHLALADGHRGVGALVVWHIEHKHWGEVDVPHDEGEGEAGISYGLSQCLSFYYLFPLPKLITHSYNVGRHVARGFANMFSESSRCSWAELQQQSVGRGFEYVSLCV